MLEKRIESLETQLELKQNPVQEFKSQLSKLEELKKQVEQVEKLRVRTKQKNKEVYIIQTKNHMPSKLSLKLRNTPTKNPIDVIAKFNRPVFLHTFFIDFGNLFSNKG